MFISDKAPPLFAVTKQSQQNFNSHCLSSTFVDFQPSHYQIKKMHFLISKLNVSEAI